MLLIIEDGRLASRTQFSSCWLFSFLEGIIRWSFSSDPGRRSTCDKRFTFFFGVVCRAWWDAENCCARVFSLPVAIFEEGVLHTCHVPCGQFFLPSVFVFIDFIRFRPVFTLRSNRFTLCSRLFLFHALSPPTRFDWLQVLTCQRHPLRCKSVHHGVAVYLSMLCVLCIVCGFFRRVAEIFCPKLVGSCCVSVGCLLCIILLS